MEVSFHSWFTGTQVDTDRGCRNRLYRYKVVLTLVLLCMLSELRLTLIAQGSAAGRRYATFASFVRTGVLSELSLR